MKKTGHHVTWWPPWLAESKSIWSVSGWLQGNVRGIHRAKRDAATMMTHFKSVSQGWTANTVFSTFVWLEVHSYGLTLQTPAGRGLLYLTEFKDYIEVGGSRASHIPMFSKWHVDLKNLTCGYLANQFTGSRILFPSLPGGSTSWQQNPPVKGGLFWLTATLRFVETLCVYESLTIWWRKARMIKEIYRNIVVTQPWVSCKACWLFCESPWITNFAFDRSACIFYEDSWGSAIVVLSLKTFYIVLIIFKLRGISQEMLHCFGLFVRLRRAKRSLRLRRRSL